MHTLESSDISLERAKNMIVSSEGKRLNAQIAAGQLTKKNADIQIEKLKRAVGPILYSAIHVCGLRLVDHRDLTALDELRIGVQGVVMAKGYE